MILWDKKWKKKNLNYRFYRIDKERSVQIFDNAGWHFNNVLTPEEISLKLKTFAHEEFADKKFSSISSIEKNIKNRNDLFGRGHKYQIVELDDTFPKYILNNYEKFKDFIIWIY